MKFQAGEEVKVRGDLAIGQQYSMEDGTTNRFVNGMESFIGQTVTISYAASYGYNVKGSPWFGLTKCLKQSTLKY